MLTKVTAYSQWDNVDPLVWNVINRPDDDLFEVRDIQGLGAVKADVNTIPKGSVKGSSFAGSNVGERNLVFTIGLDPDWDNWTVSRLRRELDKYFMPQQSVRFVFETMEYSLVEISGIVESNDPNMFSKDPEQQISVICPEPDFVGIEPIVIESSANLPIDIDYKGNVETGIELIAVHESGTPSTSVIFVLRNTDEFGLGFDFGDPFNALANLDLNSIPGEKHIHKVAVPSGDITNILNHADSSAIWPHFIPGMNEFNLVTNFPAESVTSYTLTYFERYGSL